MLPPQPPGDYTEWITAGNGCPSFKLPGGVHFSPGLIVGLCLQDRFRPAQERPVFSGDSLMQRFLISAGTHRAPPRLERVRRQKPAVMCGNPPSTDPPDVFQTNRSSARPFAPQLSSPW